MSWKENSVKNLLPLSLEQASFSVALREWLYTGDTYDLEVPEELCELCEHPEIRYQFKIINRNNGNELLVGSECINKFGIIASDELGNLLNSEASRRRVNRDRRQLISEARSRRQIATLVELSKLEQDFDINSFIGYVQDRKAFTASQLSLLFWRLSEHNILYNPRDFKIVMRRDREKAQLVSMQDFKLRKLWPAMSPTQRQWIEKHTEFRP